MNYFSDLNIIRASSNIIQSGTISRDFCDYYCLQYNHAGTINVTVGTAKPVRVTGPSLLITSPGVSFRFGTGTDEVWHHSYIAFTGKRVATYIQTGLLPVGTPLQLLHDGPGFLSTFEACRKAFDQGAAGVPLSVHLFEGLLLQLHQQGRTAVKESPVTKDIRDLSETIRTRPGQNWDFKAIASGLHVSYGHFRRLFGGITGMAPQHFLIQARLSTASKLLLEESMPVKEVAACVGIGDIHYFTKLFCRTYHLPPAKFRKELRGQGIQQ